MTLWMPPAPICFPSGTYVTVPFPGGAEVTSHRWPTRNKIQKWPSGAQDPAWTELNCFMAAYGLVCVCDWKSVNKIALLLLNRAFTVPKLSKVLFQDERRVVSSPKDEVW